MLFSPPLPPRLPLRHKPECATSRKNPTGCVLRGHNGGSVFLLNSYCPLVLSVTSENVYSLIVLEESGTATSSSFLLRQIAGEGLSNQISSVSISSSFK